MYLQKKPRRWQCGITSFAMALDVPVADLIAEIGHDGGAIPQALDHPRGFHVQELIDCCLKRGFAATPVEIFPVLMDPEGHHWAGHLLNLHDLNLRFYDTLYTTRGVIEGMGLRTGHMVAYDRGSIYDPDGYEYSSADFGIYNFEPLCAWRIDALTTVKVQP